MLAHGSQHLQHDHKEAVAVQPLRWFDRKDVLLALGRCCLRAEESLGNFPIVKLSEIILRFCFNVSVF